MPLGKEGGLAPGHIVLDGDPLGTQPPTAALPTFGPCQLWPNGRGGIFNNHFYKSNIRSEKNFENRSAFYTACTLFGNLYSPD